MKHTLYKPEPVLSIRSMVENATNKAPDAIAYKYKKDHEVISVTRREFYETIEGLGAALTARGFGSAHIACIGENSYPWIVTYLTALMSAGVYVPLDKELSPDQVVFLLNDSDSKIVFCDEKWLDRLKEKESELPNIEYFVCFDSPSHDGKILSFCRLIEEGKALPKEAFDGLQSDPTAMKDLVYTSGTTGVAKGVMLTEKNLISGVYYGLQVSTIYGCGLSVLPYNHTYEAVCDILVAIHAGVTLCINDSLRKVQENMKLFRPDYIYLVPMFAEHFYNVIQANIDKQGKRGAFRFAMGLSRFLRFFGIDVRRKLFASIHREFGGKLRKIVCGGAPIRTDIGKFFDAIGLPMTGGYGITECSPLVSVNDEKSNNFSSAGHRLPCLEWRIENPDGDGIGEICVKGDVVMKGYYKRPDLTAEVLRDGWFYTGDFGYITKNDEIVITGRKKNIIVLSNGKNVYPEELEGYIQPLSDVCEVVCSGVKNEFGQSVALRAEIFPVEGCEKDEAAFLSEVRAAMQELPHYKQIAEVTLRCEPFPKTATKKIKR